jgi:hypothetical protein
LQKAAATCLLEAGFAHRARAREIHPAVQRVSATNRLGFHIHPEEIGLMQCCLLARPDTLRLLLRDDASSTDRSGWLVQKLNSCG